MESAQPSRGQAQHDHSMIAASSRLEESTTVRLVCGSVIAFFLFSVLIAGCAVSENPPVKNTDLPPPPESDWQDSFDISTCTMLTEGRNDYFILEPGFHLVLDGGLETLSITVLDETLEVDGVETRIVEEREWKGGELIEVSRNFFAICDETKDVYYFGEDVDMYQGGELSSHSGAWRSGENDARFGLIMPGKPVLGMKYYQEIAPREAMDRAEVVSLDEELQTPAGNFAESLETMEGTALNPLEREFKTYAPGIGLIQDQRLLLTSYGFAED
jgi:hypothetical protein